MSNKTQLQTNNTTLDNYISRINAAKEVAAGLPSAGGSGGGSVETCTVTIRGEAPMSENEVVFYINGTSTPQMDPIPNFGGVTSIIVAKNSLICTNYSCGATGNVQRMYSPMQTPANAYFVTGDGGLIAY